MTRPAYGPGLRLLARTCLQLSGWRDAGVRIDEPRFVVIAAPHTSNWDLPIMLLLAIDHDVPMHWLGKHTIFRGPFKTFFEALRGIPVDRRSPQDLVRQLAARFQDTPRLVIAIPPEGTRARRDHWKSGFYRVALAAGVPVVPGYLDYARREGGFGAPIHLTGDMERDMDRFRAFYADKAARHPARVGPIRLRDEPVETGRRDRDRPV